MTHFATLLAALALPAAGLGWMGVISRRGRSEELVGVELLAPEGVEASPTAWVSFFRTLYGISTTPWKRRLWGQPQIGFGFQVSRGRLSARCWYAPRLAALLGAGLRSALPGIEIIPIPSSEGDPPEPAVARAQLRLWREDLFALGAPKDDVLHGVLGALGEAEDASYLMTVVPDVSWQISAQRRLDQIAGRPQARGLILGALGELIGIFTSPLLPGGSREGAAPRRGDRAQLPAPDKAPEPGYRVEIRLRVAALNEAQASGAIHAVVSAFRAADGANGLRPLRVRRQQAFDSAMEAIAAPARQAMVLTAPELAQLFHLPVAGVGLESAPIRVLPGRLQFEAGKVIAIAEDGSAHPITISQADCRQHIHVLGPTGAGKSTLLLNLALDDIKAGRGVGVIDPKGDLVRELLERIPKSEASRVFLMDPSHRELPVGLNVLECSDPELHDVVCDQVVAIFRKSYERFWGPRTDDILRGALLTLLRHQGATLCEVPLLLLRPRARAGYLAGLDDPAGLEPFWEEYERMAEGQRLQVVGPLLNKLRSFLLRRTVRNVLGQQESTLHLDRVLDGSGILLVSLAKGLLGEETSRLLGSFVFTRIWQAALIRADRPESRRIDFSLYLDEFQNYLHLPQGLDEVLVEARGYHLNLVLANQHLGQLGAQTREALAANARTRVVFQSGQDDARYLAREFGPHLGAPELQNLQRFQAALRLCVGGRTEPAFTGVTRPRPEGLGEEHRSALIASALSRSGRPRSEVEAEIALRHRTHGLLEPDEEKAG